MTTNLSSCVALPRGGIQRMGQVIRLGLASGTVATLFLAAGTPAAVADPVPNRLFTDCELANSTQGGRINTLAGLQADILRSNSNPPNDPEIESPVIAYVVIYAVGNDNNGQRVVDGRGGPLLGFTGPVVCRNPDVSVTTALQTDDIPNVDILDVQDALVLRHTPGANRFCHTTDGFTDCRDIR